MTIKGIPASPGVAIGKAFIYDKQYCWVDERDLSPEEVEGEVERFLDSIRETREELGVTYRKIREELGEEYARIFDSHLMMIEDRSFIDQIISEIRQERKNSEYIFSRVLGKFIRTLSNAEDSRLRERTADFLDIEHRVLTKLCGQESPTLEHLPSEVIVVARDLSPSDTAHMDRRHVLGVVTDIGGTTSHAAIISRALEIPAVVGTEMAIAEIAPVDTVIVDGIRGRVYVNPEEDIEAEYQLEQRRFLELEKDLNALRDLPAITLDGAMVDVLANIELPEEVESVIHHGAHGIGLYRTEFLYLGRADLPSEEEQYEAYRTIAEHLAPYPVVIRTLDLGGDKVGAGIPLFPEANPFLGWRAIRVCLELQDLFRTQLRAILRASVRGNVRIMFPMISGIEELLQAKEILGEVREELAREGTPFGPDCPVGAMIEVPSAALTADLLSEEAEFFSIGTNDLIQYATAVDRGNERVAYLFEPFHPGVLRMIRSVIEAGHARGLPVALCGEMSADPTATIVLLGMELDEFSMSPMAVPHIKKVIRSVSLDEARRTTEEALSLRSGAEVRSLLESVLKDKLGELPDNV